MNTNRKSPRAFRIDSSKTQSGPQHRYQHHTKYGCEANKPVGESKIGFRSTTKNDAVEEEYAEILRKIRLISKMEILGFDKAIEHASGRNREFLNEIKNKNIGELFDALNQRRGLLSKQIYIGR